MTQAQAQLLYATVLLMLICPALWGSTLQLTWAPNEEPDIGSYRIYYGPLGGDLQSMDTGRATSVSITNLVPGLIYRLFATALNQDGLESPPSPELIYDVPLAAVNADSDGDGLPDVFERASGLDPDDPADALGDLDQDGVTNIQEFLSGTDVNDPNSVFQVGNVMWEEGVAVVEFATVFGKTYMLEASDNLGEWFPVGPGTTGTGSVMRLPDLESGWRSRRFYRLIVTTP